MRDQRHARRVRSVSSVSRGNYDRVQSRGHRHDAQTAFQEGVADEVPLRNEHEHENEKQGIYEQFYSRHQIDAPSFQKLQQVEFSDRQPGQKHCDRRHTIARNVDHFQDARRQLQSRKTDDHTDEHTDQHGVCKRF